MAGLQLSGLASGFDWKTLVDQLMELERAPIYRLQSEKSRNDLKLATLSTLGGRLRDLQTATAALKADGLFTARSATLDTPGAGWGLQAAPGTAAGSYVFSVTQLATAARQVGAADIGRGWHESDDVSGLTLATLPGAAAVTAGRFTVNGQQIEVALTDSLQDVFDRIATATAGAVTARYEASTDRVVLESDDPILLGAANDTSNFLRVARLNNNGTGQVASQTPLGALAPTAPLAEAGLRSAITAVDENGQGSFILNGVTIEYNLQSDSLNAVLQRINTSAAGVHASYDAVADRVVLTNAVTGDLGIGFSEDAGGLLGALGLTSGGSFTAGQNALFSVNGGPVLSSFSNTLDTAAHGIAGLSVTAKSATTETVTVGPDADKARTAIETFITKFNAVQSYIEEQTRITTTRGNVSAALMANNREIQAWSQSLRSLAFGAVDGAAFSRLESLGIDFRTGTAELEIKDPSKLDAALRQQPAEVDAFFRRADTGFVARLDAFLKNTLGGDALTGALGHQENTLTRAQTSLTQQIADLERRLEQQRTLLETSFINMETAQANLQQMSQQLLNAFGQNNSQNNK